MVLQPQYARILVWAVPISLATTHGITLVFFSTRYLDVSVPWVTVSRHISFTNIGYPIRTSTDQSSFATPRSFSQLTTSFVFLRSLGIPHAPSFASLFSLTLSLFTCYPQIVNELFENITLRYYLVVEDKRFELLTPCVQGRCSSQLS
jgi:hypothetical protein